jgi:hypothetical protein
VCDCVAFLSLQLHENPSDVESDACDGSEGNKQDLGLELFVELQNSEGGLSVPTFMLNVFGGLIYLRYDIGELKMSEFPLMVFRKWIHRSRLASTSFAQRPIVWNTPADGFVRRGALHR